MPKEILSGICDTHIHIYDSKFPVSHSIPTSLPERNLHQYQKVQARLNISRVIVVQSKNYGTDNSCLLEVLARLGDSSRGVAVVSKETSEIEFERLTQLGVMGLRFHQVGESILSWDELMDLSAKGREFGWHVQLQMDGRNLAEREGLLKKIPTPLVIDHFGRFEEPVSPDHPGFKALLRLLDTGNVWIKLGAPYHSSQQLFPYKDMWHLAKILIKAAPQRMLWATNWPHHPYAEKHPIPDDQLLLNLIDYWTEDEKIKRQILIDNPSIVYDF